MPIARERQSLGDGLKQGQVELGWHPERRSLSRLLEKKKPVGGNKKVLREESSRLI